MVGTDFEILISEIRRINKLDGRTISDRFLKFNEEFGEFAAEVVKMQGQSHKPYDEEHLIEEGTDALQCLMSIILDICDLKQIEFQQFLTEMFYKNAKWEDKIREFKINE